MSLTCYSRVLNRVFQSVHWAFLALVLFHVIAPFPEQRSCCSLVAFHAFSLLTWHRGRLSHRPQPNHCPPQRLVWSLGWGLVVCVHRRVVFHVGLTRLTWFFHCFLCCISFVFPLKIEHFAACLHEWQSLKIHKGS